MLGWVLGCTVGKSPWHLCRCFCVTLVASTPAHPSALGCFLQVQEKCDYDLVMPLALLFYYAVLYVSPEAAAYSLIPAPGEAWGGEPFPVEPSRAVTGIGVAFV